MTATVQAGPGTATNLLFGPGADAAEALARQIISAQTDLDRTLRQLPRPPARPPCAKRPPRPPGCWTSGWTACCWPGGASTTT